MDRRLLTPSHVAPKAKYNNQDFQNITVHFPILWFLSDSKVNNSSFFEQRHQKGYYVKVCGGSTLSGEKKERNKSTSVETTQQTVKFTSLGKKLGYMPFHTEGRSSVTTSRFIYGSPFTVSGWVSICIQTGGGSFQLQVIPQIPNKSGFRALRMLSTFASSYNCALKLEIQNK